MDNLPPLPNNIGKRRTITDIFGETRYFKILDEINLISSTYGEKAIYLQRIQFEEDDRIELRLGYYIIGKKPKMAGRWVWGQYATMMPRADFAEIIKQAHAQGWL
jgi:hypothetical protein